MNNPNELETYLKNTLIELDRLAEQIRQTQDFSEHAEYIMALRELILEQIPHEDPSYTAHQIR